MVQEKRSLLLIDGQNSIGLVGDLCEKYDEVIIYGESTIKESDKIKVIPLSSNIPSFEDFRIITDAVRLATQYSYIHILSNDEIFRSIVLAMSEEITNISVIHFEVTNIYSITPKTTKEKLAYILSLKTKLRTNRSSAYYEVLDGVTSTKIGKMFSHLNNKVKISENTIDYIYSNINNLDLNFSPYKVLKIKSEREFIKTYLEEVINM